MLGLGLARGPRSVISHETALTVHDIYIYIYIYIYVYIYIYIYILHYLKDPKLWGFWYIIPYN